MIKERQDEFNKTNPKAKIERKNILSFPLFIGNTSLHFKSAVVRRVLKVFDCTCFGRYVILLPTPQGLHRKLTKSWLLNKKLTQKARS